ncbi:MAG: TraB/GumN family protein [bacterium]|nr:TraB/GumN family protein [bacterium]
MDSSLDNKNVKILTLENKTIYLVGTAHISKASVELVEKVIEEVKPDSVAVELCQSRFDSMKDPEKWKKTDIISVIKQGKVYLLMAQLILAAFQKKIGEKLEVRPGSEMMKAIEIAEKNGAALVLADREIRITLRRAWSGLGLWSSMKLATTLLASIFSSDEISQEEIERLKSCDVLESMMSELGNNLPGITTALISERDQYLAEKIKSSPGKKIVAVVGAGHVPGIERNLQIKTDLAQLEIEPPRSIWTRVMAWGIPALLVGMIIYGFFVGGSNTSIEMVKIWILVTGISAGVGAIISFSHPITVLSAALSAPITTIHPFIAAGWVAGLVEAMVRKPQVHDLENIANDITTIKGIWSNRVTRILLTIAFTNLGGMIGMFIGVPWVASLV